ncbi:MAG: Hsp20/alpha crystallin family protein [Haloarculaceae archaeon]
MSALRDALRDLPDAVFADVLESDDAYLLVVDLPGATADTVDVRAEGSRLRIEARREKDTPEGFRYLEEDRSMFLDVDLPLPPDVTGTDADGSVHDGVLELRLPKTSTTRGIDIPIDEA